MKRLSRLFLVLFVILAMTVADYSLVFAENETTDETSETETEAEDTSDDVAPDGMSSLWPEAPDIESGSALVVETNTDVVLYSKDIYTERYPASTTKILTCLIALENCSLSETVTFSKNAVTLEEGATSIDAVEGEELSMKDCLYGLMLESGNDCAIAIAEHIAGSVEGFAELMNSRAAELGCTDSHFTNPNGLYDSDHYTTVHDLYQISKVAFNNSAFCDIVSHYSYTIPATNKSAERVLESTNLMIDTNSPYYNENVIGGKTGYLVEAGRCLVTLAKHDGLSILTITLFCPTYYGVFTDTQELLDFAFNGFKLNNIYDSETRFKFSSDSSRIYLDPTSAILMPSSISVSDLSSYIKFASDMDESELSEATDDLVLTSQTESLYAVIYYYYGENFLGKINVLSDNDMVVAKASFPEITYVNTWTAVAVVIALIFILIIFNILTRRKKRKVRR